MNEVVLEPEDRGHLRHVGAGELGHFTSSDDLLGIARAAEKLGAGAVVFVQLELRDVDPLRLLAVELEELGPARGRAAEAAEVHLELPSLQFLDRILERCQPVVGAKADGIEISFGQRLEFARRRAGLLN